MREGIKSCDEIECFDRPAKKQRGCPQKKGGKTNQTSHKIEGKILWRAEG